MWCHTFQGSLYVLLGPKEYPLVTRHDWEMLMSLWPAIVRTKPSEKLSVIRLMENIVECVHKHFPTITINLQVSLLPYDSVRTRWLLTCHVHAPSHLCLQIPELCLEVARRLWDTSPAPCFPVVSEEEVAVGMQQLQMRNQHNSDQYLALLNSLMDAIQQENLWDLLLHSWFQAFAMFWMLCASFWVIPRCLNFICQRFGTLCLFHLHRPMKMEQKKCSETLSYKIQTPGNYPKEKHTISLTFSSNLGLDLPSSHFLRLCH